MMCVSSSMRMANAKFKVGQTKFRGRPSLTPLSFMPNKERFKIPAKKNKQTLYSFQSIAYQILQWWNQLTPSVGYICKTYSVIAQSVVDEQRQSNTIKFSNVKKKSLTFQISIHHSVGSHFLLCIAICVCVFFISGKMASTNRQSIYFQQRSSVVFGASMSNHLEYGC